MRVECASELAARPSRGFSRGEPALAGRPPLQRGEAEPRLQPRPRAARNRLFSLRTAVVATLLSAAPRLSAQAVDQLAVRFTGMTAVSGLEQAMTDTLLTLLPGSARDRAGNVTLVLGNGSPRRLVSCALDEVGYVVGSVTDEGFLRLRRVGSRVPYPLFDQQLEGHRVTVFGRSGPVPGVIAVRSVHLARGAGGAGGGPPHPMRYSPSTTPTSMSGPLRPPTYRRSASPCSRPSR